MANQTNAQFQAYYLQRATAELAEDLDALRNADDFAMASRPQTGATNGSENHGAPTPTFDTPLQMLIEALRQGADMFDEQDQQRVVAGAAAHDDKKT